MFCYQYSCAMTFKNSHSDINSRPVGPSLRPTDACKLLRKAIPGDCGSGLIKVNVAGLAWTQSQCSITSPGRIQWKEVTKGQLNKQQDDVCSIFEPRM